MAPPPPPPPPQTPSKNFNIAVIGGGIGGLSLAIGLLHQGVPVHVYEAAPAFAEIGAGISFGPNATRAMRMIDPAIKEGYDRQQTNNGWPEKKGVWFDFRWGMNERTRKDGNGGKKAGDKICSVEAGEVGQSSVHRAHFLGELVALLPEGTATFGKRVEEVEETSNGVKLMFADGTSAEATAAIGCDGVKSRMRQIVLGKDAPESTATFTGKYAYRGLIPMPKAVELLGDELARNSQMYFGYGGHLLTFPIEKGETMNVVAFQTKDGKWESDRWVLPMKREDMEGDFKDWGQNVKDILSLMEKPDVWALFDHPAAETYCYGGKICLLGDGAHASTPHQGAGAGMALEDAFILSNLLGSIGNAGELEMVFKAYDSVRRPRTQKLVTTSREAAVVYEFQGVETLDNPIKVAENLNQRSRWIWDGDPDEELKIAQARSRERARLA